MTPPKRILWGLAALALGLRLWGLRFGLYHPDEHLIVNHALAFGAGDLNPHMFYLPTFFMYILFGMFGLFYLAGHAGGFFAGPDDFLAFFLRDPDSIYLLGRGVSAVFGAATVFAVYRLGREARNERTGVAAASLLAVNFLHVRDSHFATMDIALTFFAVWSLAFVLAYANSKNARFYWLSVVFAGMATAAKYNGALLVLPIALSAIGVAGARPQKLIFKALLSTAVFVGVFFLLSPFVILDFGSTKAYLAKLYELNRGFRVDGWAHFWNLRDACGWAVFLAAGAGFFIKPARFWPHAILAGFAAAYYVMITRAGQPFERYVLVLVPITLVWAASAADGAASRFKRLPFAWLAAALLLAALPKTIHQEIIFSRPNTREIVKNWIHAHIPEGEIIAIDDPGEAPRLIAAKEDLSEQIRGLDAGDPRYPSKKKRLEALAALSPYPRPSYRLVFLLEDRQGAEFSMLTRSAPATLEGIRTSGARYLVASETALIRARPALYEALRPYLRPEFTADSRKDPNRSEKPQSWTYAPVDETFWNTAHAGPRLSVYRLDFS